MPTIMIRNVGVLDGGSIKHHPGFYFGGNPGDILGPEPDPDAVIDGTDCTIIPGLIDSKIDAGVMPGILSTCSAYGVTTLIDSSSSCAESQAMRIAAADEPTLPSFLATGSAIVARDSSLPTLSNYGSMEVVTTADEAERVVETKLTSSRADFIKVIVDQPGLNANLLSVLVRATHRHGKLAIAHAAQSSSYTLAVDAGFDVLSPVPIDGDIESGVVARIVERGIGIIPTLRFLQQGMPLWKIHNPEYDLSFAFAAVKRLYNAGAIICAGTSANTSRLITVPFGQGLHDELQLLTTAGMSNLDAIRAATCQPTTLFGLRDRGFVRIGYRADLILVEGNPLDDIKFCSKIRRVWIRGVPIS
ncbi:amidohydrolase family protein [Metarhizium robertsii]|uniref:Amidohydrolase n=2 Tax=Metarhizium robertsii TaxID=568076 RepID=E9F2W4_METRA|nr:amidohydrolase [Metarhizium robertsii ARSEF 23]EFY97830.1 amidohydrolase [Metarhizium robertsii ARSEF 23]EXV00393.1 amidohydrolase family protein [Metarhizium robertsii]